MGTQALRHEPKDRETEGRGEKVRERNAERERDGGGGMEGRREGGAGQSTECLAYIGKASGEGEA